MAIQPAPAQIQQWVQAATDILPANATAFEVALLAAELHHDVPVPIADLWRPDTCPERLLPYLAWALSVDIWDEAWPAEKRRDIVRQSIELHRLKGTLEGIRRYAAFAGGVVERAITPPATSFLSAGLSLEERRAFMRRLPEIRILNLAGRGAAGVRSFCGPFDGADISSFDVDEAGVIPAFYIESDAGLSFGRRARLIDDVEGIDIPLVIEQVIAEDGTPIPGAERYLIPGDGTGASFLDGGPFWQTAFGETVAPARVVSVSIIAAGLDDLQGLTAIRDGLSPIMVEPERVSLVGISPDGVFCNTPLDGWHFGGDLVETQIYESIRLHDPNRDVVGGVAISFMDDDRFGIAPHTAELLVYIPDVRAQDAVDGFIDGFFVETPPDALHRVLDAIEAAAAAHETILVDTEVYRAPTLGNGLKLGFFRLGQPVRG
jgi:phage tail-like protein